MYPSSVRTLAIGVLSAVVACAPAQRAAPKTPKTAPLVAQASRPALAESALRSVLDDVLDGDVHRAAGAAWIDGEGETIATAGVRAHEGAAPFDRDTVFPVGSVSKVFVGALLAEALHRGEIPALDAPIAPLWRDKLAIPRGAEREITWEDLATHRSGLPFFPTNWKPSTEVHRAGYTLEELRAFLASYALPSEPGTKVLYGNTSYGLLALSLGEVAKQSFGDLLRTRVFRDLGMTQSGFPDRDEPPPPNFLEGWDEDWHANPWKWDPSPMAPCCVVRSSLADLAHFARELMRPGTSWNRDLALIGPPRADAPWGMGESFGLGIYSRLDSRLLFKDGQVHGIRTFLILEPAARRGLVVVASSYRVDIGDLAWRMWDVARGDPSGPLAVSRVVESAPAEATPSGVALSEALVVRSFVAPETARPGETVTASIYLECTTDSSKALRFYSDVWLGGRDGRIVRSQRLAPDDGGCTRGRLLRHDVVFTLPKSPSLRSADLWVGLTSTERGDAKPDAAFHGSERRRLTRIRAVDPDRSPITWGE